MARGDLSDAQWGRLSPLLPPVDDPTRRGNRYKDHRIVINGILWVLRTGVPWRDLPERYGGPCQTCYDRFRSWQKSGRWRELLHASQQEYNNGRLPGREADCEACAVDSTTVKAHPTRRGWVSSFGSGAETLFPSVAVKKVPEANSAGADAPTRSSQCLGCSRGGVTTKIHLSAEGKAPRSPWC